MSGFADSTGIARTYNLKGAIDFDNAFFQSLGTNGRSCGSCHQPADGWTILRGLAARAPYFHNGSAAPLLDVVEFYDGRFTIGLSPLEKSDLVAFLKGL
jgi:cytochrome c peroxidase